MGFKLVILWTDVVLWLMLGGLAAYIVHVRRDPSLRATWSKVFASGPAMASCVVLLAMLALTLVDSVHFRRALASQPGASAAYDTRTESLLDVMLSKLVQGREKSYSAPLATHGFVKETVPPKAGEPPRLDEHGVPLPPPRAYPRLKHGGAGLSDPDRKSVV